jgi:hypothetical protein
VAILPEIANPIASHLMGHNLSRSELLAESDFQRQAIGG